MDDFIDRLKKWYKEPLKNGSIGNWFLFLGIVLVIIYFWTRILSRILP